MSVIETLIVRSSEEDSRLDNYCKHNFVNLPSSKSIKKAFKAGRVLVNGIAAQSNTLLKSGDVIALKDVEFIPVFSSVKLAVHYSDEHVAVIEKPAGINSSGNHKTSIQALVASQFLRSAANDALYPAKIVHRLDKATSGLMIIARSTTALMKLGQAFEHRAIKKKYSAIVHGNTLSHGSITEDIEQKAAHTNWQKTHAILHSNSHFSLLELEPLTGRKHQLRIHLSGIGHPIAGDQEYNAIGQTITGRGMMLHASCIEFEHPISKEIIKIDSGLPKRFKKFLERSKID